VQLACTCGFEKSRAGKPPMAPDIAFSRKIPLLTDGHTRMVRV
jgi:hypothetical protein